jgi:hypothetical protein
MPVLDSGAYGGAAASDPDFWYVGGYVGYAGFSLGGAYGRGRNWRMTGATGNATSPGPFTNTIVSDGYDWTVAGAYNDGPFGVVIGYMDGRNSDCEAPGAIPVEIGMSARPTRAPVGAYRAALLACRCSLHRPQPDEGGVLVEDYASRDGGDIGPQPSFRFEACAER